MNKGSVQLRVFLIIIVTSCFITLRRLSMHVRLVTQMKCPNSNESFCETYIPDYCKSGETCSQSSRDSSTAAPPAPFRVVGYQRNETRKCKAKLCTLNADRRPVQVRRVTRECCHHVEDCVTAIVKTAFRLRNTAVLIKSIRKYFPFMRIVVADDAYVNSTISTDFQRIIENDTNITYIQGAYGISNGRNTALKEVTTKYFLLLDDDYQFTCQTQVRKMVSLLDRSDVSIVGGYVNKVGSFEGAFIVHTDNKSKTHISHYPGVAFEVIPYFPTCVAVDIVLNIFLARTKDVRKIGGWTDKLEVIEHKDFFFKIRKARLKVALCTDITLVHKSVEGYKLQKERLKRVEQFQQMFYRMWRVDSLETLPSSKYPAK